MTLPAHSLGSVALQDEQIVDSEKMQQYCDLDSLMGCSVRIQPSLGDAEEALRKGEAAEHPECGISELLIDSHTGQIEWGVLSVGGMLGIGAKDVAVPFHALQWHAGDSCYELAATKDQLESLHEFDLDEAQKTGLDRMFDVVSVSWVKAGFSEDDTASAKEAASNKPEMAEPVTGTTFVTVPRRLSTASALKGLPVYAMQEECGSIESFIVNKNTNRLELAVIGSGGVLGLGESEYLVPVQAFSHCHDPKDEDDDAGLLCLPHTKTQMEDCVQYEKPEEGVVTADAIRQAYKRFDLEQPKTRREKQ